MPGLEFDAAELTLSGAPTDLGVSELTYTVTDDNGDTASLTFTITVQAPGEKPPPPEPNQPPKADAGPDQTVNEGDEVTLNGGESSDPDGDELSYTWKQFGSPAVKLTGEATAQRTFTAPTSDKTEDVTLNFELTVTDHPDGASAKDKVVITVLSETAASLNRVTQELLPHLARTAVENAVSAIAKRAEGMASGGAMSAGMGSGMAHLARALSAKAPAGGVISVNELVDGMSFVVPLAAGA